MKKVQYNFATYYRVIGTVFILLCHFVQQSGNTLLMMSAQFFNIGVSMFFILSGFLFGVRNDITQNSLKWYGKRIKRIYIPYEIFVIFLLIVHIICNLNVLNLNWLLLALGLQGSVVGVLGGEQTWFITAILVCYLATPIIDKIFNCSKKSLKRKSMVLAIILLLPLIFALIPFSFIFTLFTPICWYALAYFAGKIYDRIRFSKKYVFIAFITICFAFGVRLIAKLYFDGTIWYDKIVTGYSHTLAAFCIFYIVAAVFQNKKPGKLIVLISNISFEVYLYHYMFCVGPLRMFNITDIWLLNCLIVLVITFLIAIIMNRFSNFITKKIMKG